jgi:potassium channel subfamily K, other eukaryote
MAAPPLPPLNFRIQVIAKFTDATTLLANVTSNDMFSAHRNGYYCDLTSNSLNLSIRKDQLNQKHIDNMIIIINAIEETTNETFMTTQFKLGDHRYRLPLQNSNRVSKRVIPRTEINQRIRLKYTASTATNNINNTNTITNTSATPNSWKTGYVSIKLKGNKLPLPESVATMGQSMGKMGQSLKSIGKKSMKKIIPEDDAFQLRIILKHIVKTHVKINGQREKSVQELNLQLNADLKRINVGRRKILFVFIGVIVFIGTGIIFFPLVENWTVLNTLYFSVVTLTTVGFGDLGPTTPFSKIFTTVWLFFGVALIAAFISIISDHLIQSAAFREELRKRNVRQQQMANDDSSSSDEEDDDDDEILSFNSGQSTEIEATKQNDLGCCSCYTHSCIKKSLKYTCSTFSPMLICSVIGIIVMMSLENLSFIDALYWSVVTGTTVGFGDISPKLEATRLFSLVYLFAAIITTGKALSAVSDLININNDTVENKLLNKKLDEKFLESLDSDGTGDVSEFEYLSAMLVLLEYVEEDDLNRVMKSFRKLDRDGSRTLSVEDLKNNLKSNRKKRGKRGGRGKGGGEKIMEGEKKEEKIEGLKDANGVTSENV